MDFLILRQSAAATTGLVFSKDVLTLGSVELGRAIVSDGRQEHRNAIKEARQTEGND